MMYQLTWITPHLATGHAPMSYAELDSIREQGVTAIVNLCGEFCDLHEIEERSGFEVYHLPVADECAPDLDAMEQALAWLDEAIYLDKKILVHCRHGIGRTGTFVSAYLLRRGLGMKMAEKVLKGSRAKPTNFSQWRLLRRYGKQSGRLAAAQPQIDNHPQLDLTPFLREYQVLMTTVDQQASLQAMAASCGREHDDCCQQPFDLVLIESMALSQALNRTLKQEQRRAVIDTALVQAKVLRTLRQTNPLLSKADFYTLCRQEGYRCPLSVVGQCLVYGYRPLRCRIWGTAVGEHFSERLSLLSRQLFLGLTGSFPPGEELLFSLPDTVSGRFVQVYFQAMLEPTPKEES